METSFSPQSQTYTIGYMAIGYDRIVFFINVISILADKNRFSTRTEGLRSVLCFFVIVF